MLKNIFKKLNIKNSIPLVIGCSAGPDSIALLHYIKNNTKNPIIVAHINHNLRKESIEEEIFLKEYCQKNNIYFESCSININTNKNIENQAREKRYEFYEKILTKHNTPYLFLAHHGDDLIETILMKIERGSNIEGYAGIKEISYPNDYHNYYIIRPFLTQTKEDLIKYNTKNNLKYYIDKSNYDNKYKRNRYRKNILPILKIENENVHKKFIKFSNNILEVEEYIEDKLNISFNKMFKNNILDLELFFLEDKYIRKRIIMKILENLYKENLYKVNDSHINNINKLILGSNGKKINLPLNILFYKNDNKLYISEKTNNEGYKLRLEDITNLPNGKVIEKIDNINLNNNFICRLSSNDIEFPLFIRTRKGGDKIYVKNMIGRKKVNDIFTENKISEIERNNWPILVDNRDEILWIPGLKKSKYDIEKNINCDIILKYRW